MSYLRSEGGEDLHIVVVNQNPDSRLDLSAADDILTADENLGFSRACNWGLSHSDSDFVAIVNDDALVQPGWLEILVETLAANNRAASAQGMNLSLTDPATIDGCGIAWNRWWRPVQIGEGMQAKSLTGAERGIFGTSATAVVYRRQALVTVSLDDEHAFDPHLTSFYEDADLAIRLRQAGFDSVFAPSARCLHAGGATSRTISRTSSRWRYAHRYLVLARLSGRHFWIRSLLLALRDALDIGQFALTAQGPAAVDVIRGWSKAARLISHFIHRRRAFDGDGSFPIRVKRAASWPSMWTDPT